MTDACNQFIPSFAYALQISNCTEFELTLKAMLIKPSQTQMYHHLKKKKSKPNLKTKKLKKTTPGCSDKSMS